MDGDYYYWDKGENFKLSPYFATKEFACKCSYPECVEQKISRTLIGKLDLVRKDINQPLIINSAYRCNRYQQFLASSGASTVVAKSSQHSLGNAVDIKPKTGGIAGFEPIVAKYFDSVGLANTYLHVDLRQGKRRWTY